MKYSGIEWIGEIPEDWDVRRVKNCFYLSKQKANQKNPTILRLARDGIQIRDISNNEGQLAANYEDYNPVLPGDLLLNPMDLYSGANCNVSEISGVISPAYANLRANLKLNAKYFDYYFKIQYWTMAMFAHGKGVSYDNRWTINNDTLLAYEIPFPQYKSQTEIVKFLNQKLDGLNNIIANQNAQIEKLKEYKQSVITEAVTKGLVPTASMKDSGIDWIGEIPSNWKIEKIKFNACCRNEKVDGLNLKYIALENIESFSGKLIETENNYEISEANVAKQNDVLFGKLRPYLAKIYAVTEDVYVSSEFAVFCAEKILYSYLKYYMLSYGFLDIVNASTYGIKMPRANVDFIKNLYIPVFNVQEQQQIVEYLDKKCAEIDELISIKQQKIEKLQEYKKSLIYEYVTGKKEVC